MRSEVIPAQITTVEDKIAGNLNLTQLLLLMIPVFWTSFVYAALFPAMRFSLYKVPLVALVFVFCIVLSLRIKGKVVFNWLFIIFRYNRRPRYYIFNKNEAFLRVLDLPAIDKEGKAVSSKPTLVKDSVKEVLPLPSIENLIKFENFLSSRKIRFSFKQAKEGGLDVAFEKEQK